MPEPTDTNTNINTNADANADISAMFDEALGINTAATDGDNKTSSNASAADEGKLSAPESGQAEANKPGEQDKSGKAAPDPKKDGQAEPKVSDEELLKAAGLSETPEKKAGRLERDLAASSKEARRLLDYSKKLEEFLQDQGIEIGKDESGLPAGLIAGKKYSKEAASFDLKFKDLPEEIQAKMEDEPQKVVDYVLDKAKKAFARVAPTIEKQISPISQERHETALKYLEDMTWESGDKKFPGLAANRKLIEQQINAPNANKALKEFYHQEPELAVSLLNMQLDHARAHIVEQVKKAAEAKETKKKAAESSLANTQTAGGQAAISLSSDGGNIEDALASAIASA